MVKTFVGTRSTALLYSQSNRMLDSLFSLQSTIYIFSYSYMFQFFCICTMDAEFLKLLMYVVKVTAEAQIEEWLTPNLRLTNSPTSTSPTLVRIMFSRVASVGLLVSTYHHVSPLTWLNSPISSTEKSYVSCSHPTFTITPKTS